MKYNFKCDCGNTKIIDCSMDEISGMKVTCDSCGSQMKRVWRASLIIPEHMKGENIEQMSYVNNLMKTRPSGKKKVLY